MDSITKYLRVTTIPKYVVNKKSLKYNLVIIFLMEKNEVSKIKLYSKGI